MNHHRALVFKLIKKLLTIKYNCLTINLINNITKK